MNEQVTETTVPYEQKKSELEQEGYSLDPNYTNDIDANIADTTFCPMPCGTARRYEAWTRRTNIGTMLTYRAVAVCENNHAQEF